MMTRAVEGTMGQFWVEPPHMGKVRREEVGTTGQFWVEPPTWAGTGEEQAKKGHPGVVQSGTTTTPGKRHLTNTLHTRPHNAHHQALITAVTGCLPRTPPQHHTHPHSPGRHRLSSWRTPLDRQLHPALHLITPLGNSGTTGLHRLTPVQTAQVPQVKIIQIHFPWINSSLASIKH
jgi:hypothetical protein